MSWEALAWAVKQKTGGPTSKLILLMLANDTNSESGVCWPSLEKIADKAEVRRRAVIENITLLERAGFVEVFHRKDPSGHRNLSNVYRLRIGGGSALNAPGVVNQDHQGSALNAPGVVHKVHPNPESESGIESKNGNPPSGAPAADLPKPKKTLDPTIKEPADRIYETDKIKFARLVVWIRAAERTYTAAVIAAALWRFLPYARAIDDGWWPYLDRILEAEEGRQNGRAAERQSEQIKRDEREWLNG